MPPQDIQIVLAFYSNEVHFSGLNRLLQSNLQFEFTYFIWNQGVQARVNKTADAFLSDLQKYCMAQ